MIIKCESCGKTFQSNKDVFCPHCGAVATKSGTADKNANTAAYDYSGKFSPLGGHHAEEDCSHGGNRSYDEYGEGSRKKSFASGRSMHTSQSGSFRSFADILKTQPKPASQKRGTSNKTNGRLTAFVMLFILAIISAVIVGGIQSAFYSDDDFDYGYEDISSKCVFCSPEVFVNPQSDGYASVYITYDGFYSDDGTGMLEDMIASSYVFTYCYAEVFSNESEIGNGDLMSICLQIQEDCIYIDDSLECGRYYYFPAFDDVYCSTDGADGSYSLKLPFDVLYITPQGEAELYTIFNTDDGEYELSPFTDSASAYYAGSVAVVV